MGILTASAIASAIRAALGDRTATDTPDSLVQQWMNWTLYDLASPRIYDHYELRSTTTQTMVAGTSVYPTAAATNVKTLGVRSVVIIHPTDPAQRRRLSFIRDRDVHATYQSPGYPNFYSTAWSGADAIEVLPAPDTAHEWVLSIRRWRVPPLFNLASAPSATSILGDQWDEPLVWGSVARGWRHFKEFEKAEVAKAEYGQLIQRIHDRARLDASDDDFGSDLYVDEVMEVG